MRNINNNEKEVLVRQKVIEGKSFEQADIEVKRDVNFIRNFNNQVREKKKEITKLNLETERANKRFKKAFERLKMGIDDKQVRVSVKEEEKIIDKPKPPVNSPFSAYATTFHLSRVLHYLEDNGPTNLWDIADDCCMGKVLVKDTLRFLLKYKFIVENKGNNGLRKYKIKSISDLENFNSNSTKLTTGGIKNDISRN